MPIKVAKHKITQNEIKDIIEFYNANKPQSETTLQYFSCKEGGFRLVPIGSRDTYRTTNLHKQLRWYRNVLVSYYNYPGFSEEEEQLLFQAMSITLGPQNVKHYKAFSIAITSSPSIKILVEDTPKNLLDTSEHISNPNPYSLHMKLFTNTNNNTFSDVTSHIWAVPRMRI